MVDIGVIEIAQTRGQKVSSSRGGERSLELQQPMVKKICWNCFGFKTDA